MKLADFEQMVDPIIVVRGKDYLDKGRITTVKEVKKNHYVIHVTGSASYKVDVVEIEMTAKWSGYPFL